MDQSTGVTANLAGEYPTYKMVDGELVPLDSRDPGRRYGLKVSGQGETICLQFSDEEEVQADKRKAEWEAGAPARDIEAKRLAEEAEKFERALKYEQRIVAFLDILGWKQAISSKDSEVVKVLGKTLARIQGVANHFNSLHGLMPDNRTWPGNAVMTQFSDSLVITVDDDRFGWDALKQALWVLTTSLVESRLLLRGGVVRGELFHAHGLVFGPALIEAYELESKVASNPRVILSKELSAERHETQLDGSVPWIPSADGYLFFNFLPPFMGSPLFTDHLLWQHRLGPIRELILKMAQAKDCSDHVFDKYVWLAEYFDSVCDQHRQCGVDRVLHEALQLRGRGIA